MKKIYRILFSILICFTLIIIGNTFFMVSAQQQVPSASAIERGNTQTSGAKKTLSLQRRRS